MIEQKLITCDSPIYFSREVNERLREGSWTVVPHTHVARWENVCCSSAGAGNTVRSEKGYFAIVLQRQEVNMPDDLMADELSNTVADVNKVW